MKVDHNGIHEWTWFGRPTGARDRTMIANAAAELPQSEGGGLLIVGVTTDANDLASRSVTKLSLGRASSTATTPVEYWTLTAFGDGPTMGGAWEFVSIASDGVLLAGVDQYDCVSFGCSSGLAFKSGGNIDEGQGVAMKLPFQAFSGATAPSLSQIQGFLSSPGYWVAHPLSTTVKEARQTPDLNGVIFLLQNSQNGDSTLGITALMRVGASDGSTVIWGPNYDATLSIGEGTAMQLSNDGTIVVGGLNGRDGRYQGSGITVGRMTTFNGQTGAMGWTGNYSEGGEPELIRRECWGVVALPSNSGFALICGTGIEPEMCVNTLPPAVLANCTAGIGDNRPGAVPRPPDIWQNFVVMTDFNGGFQWSRVD
eukprot:3825707-Prymnesium_polylepis.1